MILNQAFYIFSKYTLILIWILPKKRYKIGKSKALTQRISTHNSSHADNLELLFIDDIDRVENCLKAIMQPYQYRRKKEIYEINLDALKKALTSCANSIREVELVASGKQIGGFANKQNDLVYLSLQRD